MAIINDYAKIESFLGDKLLEAQLDSFRVYSIELQLNFLADSDAEKRSYWLSAMGSISINDKSSACQNRPQVLPSLYGLVGQRINAVKIEDDGVLALSIGSKVLTIGMDDEVFEVVWSVTPESPEPFAEHDWSVTFTDESELVMT